MSQLYRVNSGIGDGSLPFPQKIAWAATTHVNLKSM